MIYGNCHFGKVLAMTITPNCLVWWPARQESMVTDALFLMLISFVCV